MKAWGARGPVTFDCGQLNFSDVTNHNISAADVMVPNPVILLNTDDLANSLLVFPSLILLASIYPSRFV